MSETKLKPCPFCGEEPFCGTDAQGWGVICTSMQQCDVSPTTTYHESEEDAVAAWNNRPNEKGLTFDASETEIILAALSLCGVENNRDLDDLCEKIKSGGK